MTSPITRRQQWKNSRKILKEVLAVVAALIFVLPVLWMVLSSFQPG